MGFLTKKTFENREVCEILALQKRDGGWGYFHSLSAPTKDQPLRTEQALRRLWVLGFTKDDRPIKRALALLRKYLSGRRTPPDGREKAVNWKFFERLMFATWIKIFVPDDTDAAETAQFWAEIVTISFQDGHFDEAVYESEYRKRIPKLINREKLIMPNWFYLVHLLKNILDPQTESRYIHYLLNNDNGIFYIYQNKIADVPEKSDERYRIALAQLKGYSSGDESAFERYKV